MLRRLALTTITALLALPLALGLVAEPAQAQQATVMSRPATTASCPRGV